jgi:uncharacterized RDD family membrane protein YckC
VATRSPTQPARGGLPLASLARRYGALLYELLLLTAIVFVVSFVLLPLVTPGHAGSAQSLSVPAVPERVALFCLLFSGVAAYFVWSWSDGRRTLPMKTWRLQLVAVSGTPLSRKTALLRYLATWIGPVLALAVFALLHRAGFGAHALWLVAFNFLWGFVDRDRQFLHDRIAGSRIVLERKVGSAVDGPAQTTAR